MDVDKVMDGLIKELGVAIKAMGKAKKLDEKEAYSRIVKNLSESFPEVYIGKPNTVFG